MFQLFDMAFFVLKQPNLAAIGRGHSNPTRLWFWCLAVGQIVLWTAICLVTQPNMPMDMIEMLYWGQQWQWGYHKHPPLPAWTAAMMWSLGGNHPWALYLAAQLTITVTMWAVWQLAGDMLAPRLAFCSVVVLMGCYYCTYLINDINNTIMTRPFWALTILFLYRALMVQSSRRKLVYWCLTGAAIGLGMLCKYYMAVLVLCLMLVPLFLPQTRVVFRTAGPYMMVGIAVLLFFPHFVWMIENDFATVSYIFDRSANSAASQSPTILASWQRHIRSPIWFLVTQAGAFIPMLLLLMPLYFRASDSINRTIFLPSTSATSAAKQTFDLSYLLIAVAGPIGFYLILAVVSGVPIRSMWGGPLFSFVGLLWLVAFKIRPRPASVRWVVINSVAVGLVMASALFVRNSVLPLIRNKFSRIHYPGQQVAEEVQQAWKRHVGDRNMPLPVVGGHMFVAGCVGVYSPSKVDVYPDLAPDASPWTSDEDLRRRGGMIVWNADRGELPPDPWKKRFPSMENLRPVKCKSGALMGAVSANVGIAFIRPQGLKRVMTHGGSRDELDRTVAH